MGIPGQQKGLESAKSGIRYDFGYTAKALPIESAPFLTYFFTIYNYRLLPKIPNAQIK